MGSIKGLRLIKAFATILESGRPDSAAADDLERRYYLDFPDVLSLEEFVRKLGEERPFR